MIMLLLLREACQRAPAQGKALEASDLIFVAAFTGVHECRRIVQITGSGPD
jgi:hypothetical protein